MLAGIPLTVFKLFSSGIQITLFEIGVILNNIIQFQRDGGTDFPYAGPCVLILSDDNDKYTNYDNTIIESAPYLQQLCEQFN